jgi:molybdenum cofactor cytidylyltransferase
MQLHSPPVSAAKIAAIILAAGASTRMGTPKQLLMLQGKSLLRRVTETAIAADCSPVVVVLGAGSDRIRDEVSHLPVKIVENPEWRTGMGSSVRSGIHTLHNTAPEVDAAILLLCDQPFVTVQTMHQLILHYRLTQQPIVASTYQGIVGVPTLFDAKFFGELSSLSQAEGARAMIQRHQDSVVTVEFPQGAIDIDTPSDYQRCLEQFYP